MLIRSYALDRGGEGGASVAFPNFPPLIHPSEKFYEKTKTTRR